MMYLIAIVLPFAACIFCGRWKTGIIMFGLQLTVLGWLPAAFVAWNIVRDQNFKKIMRG